MLIFAQEYPSSPRLVSLARHDVARFAEFCGFPAEGISDVVLAAGEAFNNAVEHAHTLQNFSLWCEFDGRTLHIRVQDRGIGFAPQSQRHRRDGALRERGYGLVIMNGLMDKTDYAFEANNGTILTLEKRKTA